MKLFRAKSRIPVEEMTVETRCDEKAGLGTGRSQVIDVLEAQINKETVGLDLGDRNSWYCGVDEAGQIQLEQRVRTNAKGLQEIFGAMPCNRIALEIGTHSPWVSRLLFADEPRGILLSPGGKSLWRPPF